MSEFIPIALEDVAGSQVGASVLGGNGYFRQVLQLPLLSTHASLKAISVLLLTTPHGSASLGRASKDTPATCSCVTAASCT